MCMKQMPKMEQPAERVTRIVLETEEGQNSIAYIIKEELHVEEDDEDCQNEFLSKGKFISPVFIVTFTISSVSKQMNNLS